MPVIPAGEKAYSEGIRAQLEKLAAEWPDRDFWYVTAVVSPGSWSSKPCGATGADIIRYSPAAMQAALEEMRNG